MKYKVGDKVLIRGDLEHYSGYEFMSILAKYRGQTVTITEACEKKSGKDPQYQIDNGWYVSDEMIERRIDMFTKDDLKVGYVVKLRNGELRMIMPSTQGDVTSGSTHGRVADLRSDLTSTVNSDYDVEKVWGLRGSGYRACEIEVSGRDLLWERKPEITELSLQQIADKFGVPVETLRVKE